MSEKENIKTSDELALSSSGSVIIESKKTPFDELGFASNHLFKNMRECVAQSKGLVPIKWIKECRDKGEGVCNLNGSIKWEILLRWLNKNKVSAANGNGIKGDNISLEEVKIELGKKDLLLRDKELILRDLEIAKKRGQMIDPEEVEKWMGSFALLLGSILRSKKSELISKCTGYEKMLEREFNDIFVLIKKEVDVWKK